MSISGLMRAEPHPSAAPAAAAPDGVGQLLGLRGRARLPASADDAANALTKYLPTEIVATYTAILPFLVPKDQPLTQQDFGARWAVAGAVATIGVLYALGIYKRQRKGKDFQWLVALRRSAFMLLAFAGWVCALPGSPFNSFSWYTPSLGAIIGLLDAAFLGAVALLFEP